MSNTVIRLSKQDLEALSAFMDYRIDFVKKTDWPEQVKNNVILQMSHESLAEQVHYAIQQIWLDYDLVNM